MAKLTQEDKDFLKTYKAGDYERPSVTVDMLIFSVYEGKLFLMLIKRKAPPFRDHWAIPGGFLDLSKKETIEDAAKRELKEETNIEGTFLEKFNVYSAVDRDPRTRVISVAHVALVPFNKLYDNMRAGDDAKEIDLFQVCALPDSSVIKFFIPTIFRKGKVLHNTDLAFDHAEIIKDGLRWLQKQIRQNSKIAFNLLDEKFTTYDLQKIHETILGKKLIKSNFRRYFKNDYIDTGLVEELNETSTNNSSRPAKLYSLREVL